MPGGLAVVLSGGGAKGAFQVGVLDELITVKKVKVDIFAGVSTGAIQALGGAMNDMPGLLKEWLDIKGNKDIYKKRTLGAAGAIFGADSIYDAKPLRTKLNAYASAAKLKAAKKTLLVGVVSLGTGKYQTVDQTNPNIGDWVYASSAQPAFFQPLETKDGAGVTEQWVDGGVREIAPLSSALKLKPRAVLVIMASALKEPPAPGKTYGNLADITLRAAAIQQQETMENDIGNAMLINDLLGARERQLRALMDLATPAADIAKVMKPLEDQLARYAFAPIRVLRPDNSFVPADTLTFDPKKIGDAIEAGREAVRAQWDTLGPFLSAGA